MACFAVLHQPRPCEHARVDPVDLFLLTIAVIFLIGIMGELVFERTGIPDVIWLILVGIFVGPITGFVQREQLLTIAPYFGALTLVIVLFDGGSELRLGELREAAGRSVTVAVVGFLFAIGVIAPVSMFASWAGALPDTWTWLHAIALGSIIGGSSSVVIMPAVRKAGLAPKISNLLNLESAITDVLCVVCTVACVNIAMSGQVDAATAGIALAKSFGIGIGVGGAVGIIGLLFLRQLKKSHYGYPSMLGALLVLYVIVQELGGSAALAILTAAVIAGNAPQLSHVVGLAKAASIGRGVANVHDQITFFIKSFFFTFIGAMLSPPWGQIALGVMLGVLLLVSRVPAVGLSLIGSKLSLPAKGLVAVSLPRGMAAGVLAMVPAQAGMPGTESLSVVVFACVFTTILIFAGGFPILKRRLVRSDPSALAPLEALKSGTHADASRSALAVDDDSLPPPEPKPPLAALEGAQADFTVPDPRGSKLPADATSSGEAIPLTQKARGEE